MKINIKILMVTVLIVCCVNTTGCVSFPKNYNIDTKPIYPELGDTPVKYYQVIDTLQPELRWKDIKSADQTYDVCIWETPSHEQGEFWYGVPFTPKTWGNQVYYVEGIGESYHKVSKQLKPNTCYRWSVRTRKGKDVSEWSSFSQSIIGLFAVGHVTNVPYGFITPQE
jgi:hypothetical protein